jgi:SAM-dependent methyltransferase
MKDSKVLSEYDSAAPPPLVEQERFWDSWNASARFREGYDEFMDRQRETAQDVARRAGLRNARILDAGCGTGWLGSSLLPFGRVWGIDLSQAAIAEGIRRHPGVQLTCGDFLQSELPGPFDLIVMADSLTNMYDQAAGTRRVAAMLREGSTYLLMTPNRDVWRRRSGLKPKAQGQVMVWPPLSRYKELLKMYFTIESISTIVPGGDSGLLWWVENRWVRGGMGRLIGRRRWRDLLEAAGLGREFVIVARRNGATV